MVVEMFKGFFSGNLLFHPSTIYNAAVQGPSFIIGPLFSVTL